MSEFKHVSLRDGCTRVIGSLGDEKLENKRDNINLLPHRIGCGARNGLERDVMCVHREVSAN